MGCLNRIGTAIKGGAQKLGKAVSHGVDAGVRLMSNVGAVAHKVASKVSSVAGAVGDVAAMSAPALTALGPGVGEAAAGGALAVAGLAKGAQKAAGAISRGGDFMNKAATTTKNIQRDTGKAIGMAKDLAANPNMADAKRYGGQVASMVRHNAGNVQDARAQARRIAKG